VDNCHIEHYGQVIPSYRPGVSLSGVGNACTHNLIHHTVHQGVWFNGNDHRIAFNVIHDTCQYNDDAGAIYCCQRDWTKRGTVIEYNLIHQTGKRPYPTMNDAIYLDDFSSGNVVRGNIVNGGTLGVHIGGGNGNTVVSNVLVACETGIRVSSRRGAHFGGVHVKGEESYLYKQLLRDRARYEDGLWRSRYPEMARLLAMPDKYLAHDPLFNRIKDNVLASSGDLLLPPTKESIPYFDVTNNVFVDGADVFVDFRGLDFRIRPGSAAWRIVRDLPVERMGLYASPDRLTPAVRFGQDVARPAGPPKRPFSPAVVRIDVHTPKLPDGVEALALDDMRNCDLLASQKGRRVYAIVAARAPGEWTEYSFAFTPACDAVCTFALSGGYGGKTEYAAIRAEGLDIADGGFMQENTSWRNASGGDPRGRGDNGPPYGPQRGFAVANHVRQTVQTVRVKKGVRVTVSFRARALP
jgi:parallel beta-helix repeat protein